MTKNVGVLPCPLARPSLSCYCTIYCHVSPVVSFIIIVVASCKTVRSQVPKHVVCSLRAANVIGKVLSRIVPFSSSDRQLVNGIYVWSFSHSTHFVPYKTLVKSSLMYGAEIWVLSEADESRLGVFERKILPHSLPAI